MTETTKSDQQLISDLQALLDQVKALKKSLYIRRPGCACDEKHLCALHAGAYNHLDLAGDELETAITYAKSEG